jgi:hypothetical protein
MLAVAREVSNTCSTMPVKGHLLRVVSTHACSSSQALLKTVLQASLKHVNRILTNSQGVSYHLASCLLLPVMVAAGMVVGRILRFAVRINTCFRLHVYKAVQIEARKDKRPMCPPIT